LKGLIRLSFPGEHGDERTPSYRELPAFHELIVIALKTSSHEVLLARRGCGWREGKTA